MRNFSLGIDIGGTFVDVILFDWDTGELFLEKDLTTPENPSDGVLAAMRKLDIGLESAEVIVHGTTLGLNAIIERRGAKPGIITNKGFRDIFELGRGDLPPEHMYDIHYQRPDPLVQRRNICGVSGRVNVFGDVEVELNKQEIIKATQYLVDEQGLNSIAICCLHSYKNPSQENQIAEIIREAFPNLHLSISNQVIREYREYERTCTTVLDAYIRPIFENYVDELDRELRGMDFAGNFLIMRSSGGTMTAKIAKRRPLDSVMSGPAGGIVGAKYLAKEIGLDHVLTMDFGGTSLDTCVIENAEPSVIHESRLQHHPVLIPSYDIRCIGAGGGSIAWLEEGMLRLGPQSAGANPGPIAYDRGGSQPTLTDAALILGFIDPVNFLNGQLPLNLELAKQGIETELAAPMDISLIDAAALVFSVLIAQTEGAVREITVEQGKDYKDFSVLAFGGAGPLVAPLLALEMGIPTTIIPKVPAAFSAWGMLMSDIATDVSRTFIAELTEELIPEIEVKLDDLQNEAEESLAQQGIALDAMVIIKNLEIRYVGQEHTIKLQIPKTYSHELLREMFDTAHESRYGHCTAQPLELVNLRVTGIGQLNKPSLKKASSNVKQKIDDIGCSYRDAYCFKEKSLTTFSIYVRSILPQGIEIAGPAIIDEGTSTTVIYTSQSCYVNEYGQMIITTTL
tara:strand:+ start:12184 stop:14226 length:2043 start_codon:yes stop_codon:yes gene_type:complete